MNKAFVGGREPVSRTWDYEIILYKGDEIVDIGTVAEIAERRGVQKMTIRYYLTPAGHRRADKRKKGGTRAVRADEEGTM